MFGARLHVFRHDKVVALSLTAGHRRRDIELPADFDQIDCSAACNISTSSVEPTVLLLEE